MAAACLHVIGLSKQQYQSTSQPMLSHLNVGTGVDVSIKELAETIQQVVDYQGEIIWDICMPDGAPRKLMDVSKINELGWQAKITLPEGLVDTYKWFIDNQHKFKAQ